MEIEKMKEIKKALEYAIDMGLVMGKNTMFVNIKLVDILTLINELEIENERLSKSDASKEESSIEYYNLYKDLKRKNKDLNELCELQRVSIAENFVRENQLKDQISELESQKEKAYELLIEKNEKITKLENENELLRNAKVVYENVDYCYEDLKKAEKRIAELESENQQLKNKITKLEKEIKDSLQYAKGYGEGVKATVEVYTPKTLKQFAERLKEKCEWNKKQYCCEATVSTNDIDETLKEIGEEYGKQKSERD